KLWCWSRQMFLGLDALDETSPYVGREAQVTAGGCLTVADADIICCQRCDLNAVAIHTERAFPPVFPAVAYFSGLIRNALFKAVIIHCSLSMLAPWPTT